MKASTVLSRSLRYYWRTHLGVILGSALGAMVLTGALLVGDSVKATLRNQAMARVGKIQSAFTGGERFFRSELASKSGEGLTSALMVRGSTARADGKARVNQAQVIGVDDPFWEMAPGGKPDFSLQQGEVGINKRLAAQLGVAVGETIIVRLEKPSTFSRDAPLSGDENEVIAIRAKVAGIADDEEFGRFALQASQVPPFTIFAPLKFLQQRLELHGQANLLLSSVRSTEDLRDVVQKSFTTADAGIELRNVPTGGVELRSQRVFLDQPIVTAAPRGVDALTYLVNELRVGEKVVPYSMVTALDAPSSGFLPAELADDEIAISQWLAEDLGIKEGSKVTLKYFVMGERRQLEERAREFTVLAVIPQSEPQLNESWMPDFPGLKDAENCRDWKPGFAMDMSKIRDKDEKYWDEFGGTPKAFVNIMVGQEMWGNRWGDLTAIRYPAGTDSAKLANEIQGKLTPDQLGMGVLDLRGSAIAATDAPVDFGQLFVAFSFFLLAAAAVLTGLLFVFSLQQRNQEAGLLLALGWTPRRVRRLFLAEGFALALVGSVLGAAGGVVYTQAVLRALSTVWRGAVGAVEFHFAPSAVSVIGGIIGSVAIAMLAMWLASRRQLRHSARELLTSSIGEELQMDGAPIAGRDWTRIFAGACVIGAMVLLATAKEGSPGVFFGAGSLLLLAGLAVTLAQLRRSAAAAGGVTSLSSLGHRGAARRRGRSLATVAVLASGVFMVVAVSSFRKSADAGASQRDSGTGGFTLIGDSSLPVYEDLNAPQGREAFGLDEKIMAGAQVVPLRLREGDDASCLNLNRALQPRLLGVKPEELRSRGAFRFGKVLRAGFSGWDVLDADTWVDGEAAVPAVVDENTLMWALQMKLGDTIEYVDGRGQPFKVQLAGTVSGSMLQGNLLISEKNFIARFPNLGGYRFFLIDAPQEQISVISEHLSRQLQDRGFEVTPASRRLAEFQAVENTYLSIFQALGGLGLLLGSAGLAIVVARNVLERRREFALLEAVGFRARQLRRVVFAEHRWLILSGLVVGTLSAFVAVRPQLQNQAGGFPWMEMTALLVALTLGALFWTWLATRLSLRGRQVGALGAE
jgi:putative ABC transport system permease protein